MPGYVLGLNPGFGGFNYHDPSVCLLRDGAVVAMAEEERYTRQKSAPAVFPGNALRACLKYAGIGIEAIDAIGIGYSAKAWQQRLEFESRQAVRELSAGTRPAFTDVPPSFTSARAREGIVNTAAKLVSLLDRSLVFIDDARCAERIRSQIDGAVSVPVLCIEHHLSHAASALHPSGFEAATVLVLDGLGEFETVSAWRGENGDLQRVSSETLPNSIGYFYAAVTDFLGFKGFEGEGKTMALAPYGRENRAVVEALGRLVAVHDKGFDVSRFVTPLLGDALLLDLDQSARMLSEIFEIPPRRPDLPLEQIHRDIAWAAQDFLERAVSAFALHAMRITGHRKLCFAGGVALNCKLNMVLRELPDVERLYVQPCASDAGLALGAALVVARQQGARVQRPLAHLRLVPTDDCEDLHNKLRSWGWPFERPADLFDRAAKAIADGKIIMWYWGRSEVGPRALGARSIVGDPRSVEIRDRINRDVKRRDKWRPFGPSMLESHAPQVLEGFAPGDTAPYMIQAYRMKPEWRDRVPAVVHEGDGSTRPHTVRKEQQPEYWAMIEAFFKLTGVPMVINTSLNDRGEPLVETPTEALRDFATSAADILVMNGTWLEKPANRPK